MDFFVGNIYIDDKRSMDDAQLKKYISSWNKKIKKEDTVYIVSGILNTINKGNIENVNKLNGKKILIFSEKDKKNIDEGLYTGLFFDVLPFKEFTVKNKTIFAAFTPFLFNKYPKGGIILYAYSMNTAELGIKDTIFYSRTNKVTDENNIKFIDINWRNLPGRLPLSIDEILSFKEVRAKKKRTIKLVFDKKTVKSQRRSRIINEDKIIPQEEASKEESKKKIEKDASYTKKVSTAKSTPKKTVSKAADTVSKKEPAVKKKPGRKPKTEVTKATAKTNSTSRKTATNKSKAKTNTKIENKNIIVKRTTKTKVVANRSVSKTKSTKSTKDISNIKAPVKRGRPAKQSTSVKTKKETTKKPVTNKTEKKSTISSTKKQNTSVKTNPVNKKSPKKVINEAAMPKKRGRPKKQ